MFFCDLPNVQLMLWLVGTTTSKPDRFSDELFIYIVVNLTDSVMNCLYILYGQIRG